MSEAPLEPFQMPEQFTKAEKSTKSGSLARRAIGYLPAVAGTGLMLANAANAAGFVQNPALKTALKTANAITKYAPLAAGTIRAVGQHHSLRRQKQSMGY